MAKKIILDLDTGVDDALALSYALASEELDVIGVTGTYGNVLLETGARNNLAILELFGRTDVPVYAGLPHASTRDGFEVLEISEFIHGKNGIGEAELPEPAGEVADGSAVDFLIDSVKQHGDDLVIVATGPMTNLAAAIRQDPGFADNAHIVIMGGALTVPGNVAPWAEANINQDPDAADELFRAARDVTMIGLDVTLQTLLTYEETAKWRELGTRGGDFLAVATDYYIKAYETTAPHLGGCGLHDPLAVAVAVDPSLVTCLDINMKVDTEGETRGRTIGNEERLNDPVKTAKVAVGVDVERFLNELMTRLTKLAESAK
ncbi:nucleoside hydrolase [Corynebacterium halotolerans]|uniref:nucleoside hydrolase n=1 Tax=Corynebacterium halotolerans TaxID=225326 RepID=UPI003CF57D80